MNIAIIFVTPAILLGFAFLIVKLRKLAWIDDVGLRSPRTREAVIWVAAYIALAAAGEAISNLAGMESPAGDWRGKYDFLNLAIRIAAIAVIYPIAEELLFRGAILASLRARFGSFAAIIGSAALFSAVHLQYDWRGMALIFVDAVFYAVCRIRSGSLFLAIGLHMLGNSFAVVERLTG